ncbi:lytic transglycosylase, partial [Burkholderia pseudomallei]|nr:lytic transglycosylase [Burkholderia pseudomallei]
MSARRAEAARPRGYAARIARVAAAFAIGIVSAG